MLRDINLIVIHCADTYASMNIGVDDIRQWHIKKGWKDVGYHYVIRRDGTIEFGRSEKVVGAHAHGYNSRSIGICYAGGLGDDNQPCDNRTPAQIESMHQLVKQIVEKYPKVTILGHRDLDGVTKACPCFDVINEFKKYIS